MAIKCPGCGGEFDDTLAQILVDVGVDLVGCSRCGTAFSPAGHGAVKGVKVEVHGNTRDLAQGLLAPQRAKNAPPTQEPESPQLSGDSIPAVVYKYRVPEDRSIRVLTDRKLYCGPPCGLNDPLDCQFDMKAEVVRALERITPEVQNDFEQLRRVAAIRSVLLGSADESNESTTFIEQHAAQVAEAGVLCFSSQADIAALWAHYAANHTGFCLGFNPISLVRDPPVEASAGDFGEGSVVLTYVSYGVEHPFDGPLVEFVRNEGTYGTIDSEELRIAIAVSRTTFESLFVKTAAWSYEKELRLVWTSKSGFFPFKNTSLTSIVYGLRMDPGIRARIEEVLGQAEWSHVRRQQIALSAGSIGIGLRDCE